MIRLTQPVGCLRCVPNCSENLFNGPPAAPSLHLGNRRAGGAPSRRRVEYSQSGACGARVHDRQPLAKPRRIPEWSHRDGGLPQAQIGAHTIDDELGTLDFDVATNSQGLEVKSFTVKSLSRDASHASVVANLTPDNWVRHSDRENEIHYDLVWGARRRRNRRYPFFDRTEHLVVARDPGAIPCSLRGTRNAEACSHRFGVALRFVRHGVRP